MHREQAEQYLAATLQTRVQLIKHALHVDEQVIDCGEVNELALNTFADPGAGEALLFVTNQRLILCRDGRSEPLAYEEMRWFRVKDAPPGMPHRGVFRELTLALTVRRKRVFICGRKFAAQVESVLRRTVLNGSFASRSHQGSFGYELGRKAARFASPVFRKRIITCFKVGAIGVAALAVILGFQQYAQSNPQPTERTPLGYEMNPAELEAVERLATSGALSSATEGSLIRAVSGNWNEALGYYPGEDQIAWLKDVVLYVNDEVEQGAGCFQIATVFDDLADALDTDQGRASYIFAGGMLAWASPATNQVVIDCFT